MLLPKHPDLFERHHFPVDCPASTFSDKGATTIPPYSVIKAVDTKRTKYNEGELIRWLGESILYPTNSLPGNHCQRDRDR